MCPKCRKEQYDLRKLAEVANEACDAAKLYLLPSSQEAINWGNLSCDRVEFCTDGGYSVFIEGASSSAEELKEYIQNYLKENGFTENIKICIEW